MDILIQEREKIYQEPKIVKGEELVWKHKEGEGSNKLSATVIRQNGEELQLRGTMRGRYSFALYYKNTILIRQWDIARHTNPDGSNCHGSHKHPRADRISSRWAYSVADIPLNSPSEALQAFLKECNINIQGEYRQMLF